MRTAMRTTLNVLKRTPAAVIGVAMAALAGQTPPAGAATAAVPALAPTTINAPPANVQPATPAPTRVPAAAVPAVPSVGTVRAPIQVVTPTPTTPVALNPAGTPSMAPPVRTLLRDAMLFTGRRYTRTVVVPSSGTIQIIAELRGASDATLNFEPTSVTGGDRFSVDLRSPAANHRHGATLVGQRLSREYQVTSQQVAKGGNFIVSVTPVAASLGGVPSELSFEINLK